LKLAVSGVLSLAPFAAEMPVGTETVTLLRGMNASVGVKVTVFPRMAQDPAVLGSIAGKLEPLAIAAEKLIETGVKPPTPVVPVAGEIEVTVSGELGGGSVVEVEESVDACGPVVGPGEDAPRCPVISTPIATPVPSTTRTIATPMRRCHLDAAITAPFSPP
jgi:hypothetical protein